VLHEKILVVEDNPVSRMDIRAALGRAGYEVAQMVSTGKEAVEIAGLLRPDLVIMDIQLEGEMDGPEAAAEITRRFDIPIVFLTVYADAEMLRWTRVSGPCGYLLKPVDHIELQSAIEIALYKHKLEVELRDAKKAAEAAARAKTSFLATVSHELRTPMNGVLGMAELLLLSELEAPYRENVQLIKESALSLLSVLNQLIDYSRLESSYMKLSEVDFRLEDIVTGILSQYRRTAESKGVDLKYGISDDIPEWVLGDSSKIRQVLGNLLSNAVKFTGKGHVSVDISLAKRMLADDRILPEKYFVKIVIEDTGIGIPVEKMDQMFESFTQATDHLLHTTGSLGLGLAVVSRLVAVLKATINCTSVEGEGSVFTVVVPLKESSFVQETPMAAIKADKRPLHGIRVLVAEDDLVSQRYIMRLLEKMGCTVALADDGGAAVTMLQEDSYDIVLMDIEMPVMNGIEATRTVRNPMSRCRNSNVPIIALTAHAMWGDEQRCMHAGMDGYITKPVDIDTVASIIRVTLNL
tara:strand:+ start:49430 stop:50995 length:1566 start_codon:yes stop_codon:yes gene_type:complete